MRRWVDAGRTLRAGAAGLLAVVLATVGMVSPAAAATNYTITDMASCQAFIVAVGNAPESQAVEALDRVDCEVAGVLPAGDTATFGPGVLFVPTQGSNGRSFVNNGTVITQGSSSFLGGLYLRGVFENNGILTLTTYGQSYGTLINRGTVNVQSNFFIGGPVDNTGGTVACASTGFVMGDGSVTGNPLALSCDRQAPNISVVATKADGTPYTAGTWSNQLVTVAYTCSDPDPGLASGVDPAQCSTPATVTAGSGITVTRTVQDRAGNQTSVDFGPIRVDRVNPTIAASATTADGAPYAFGSTAREPVTVRYTCSDPELGDGPAPSCPPDDVITDDGTVTLTRTTTDRAGNTASVTFTVVVASDTTAPVITVPALMVAEAVGPDGSVVSYAVSAEDETDGAVAVGCSPASGAPFPLGTTTVTCTAADAAGNQATKSFDVIVRDTTGPVVTVPADISVAPTAVAGATVSYPAASASDVVDGAVVPTCSPASGSTFGFGATTVTCTARDAAGNTSTASFSVTVRSLELQGFYLTIRNTQLNVTGRGAPVPLLFNVFAGPTKLTTPAAAASITQTPMSCPTRTTPAAPTGPARNITTLSPLTYSRILGTLATVWSGPREPGCYQLTVTTVSGSKLSALFRFL